MKTKVPQVFFNVKDCLLEISIGLAIKCTCLHCTYTFLIAFITKKAPLSLNIFLCIERSEYFLYQNKSSLRCTKIYIYLRALKRSMQRLFAYFSEFQIFESNLLVMLTLISSRSQDVSFSVLASNFLGTSICLLRILRNDVQRVPAQYSFTQYDHWYSTI